LKQLDCQLILYSIFRPCGCLKAGSFNNTPSCNLETGECRCKLHVEGKRCSQCKSGYFNLKSDNEVGCLPCFCYGHSSVCRSALNFYKYNIESYFTHDTEGWTAQDKLSGKLKPKLNENGIKLEAAGHDVAFFIAPPKFLGDQKSSYNQFLTFNLKIENKSPRTGKEDIILEGSGLKISQEIINQENPVPSARKQFYRFRLSERDGWSPKVSFKKFMHILSNLTALKIRGVYSYDSVGFISHVRLESAQQLANGQEADWIEACECPPGYAGQHCQSCAPGFKRNPLGKGPYTGCIPCKCIHDVSHCDPASGELIKRKQMFWSL